MIGCSRRTHNRSIVLYRLVSWSVVSVDKRFDGGGWPVSWIGHWNWRSIGCRHKRSKGNTIFLNQRSSRNTIVLNKRSSRNTIVFNQRSSRNSKVLYWLVSWSVVSVDKRLDGGGWPVSWSGHWNSRSIGCRHKRSKGNTILSHWGTGHTIVLNERCNGHTILLSWLLIGRRSIGGGGLVSWGRTADNQRSSRHSILLQRLGQGGAILLGRYHRGGGDSVILEQGV